MQEQPFLPTLLQPQQLFPSPSRHCSSRALPTTGFPFHLKVGELPCCLPAPPCSWSLPLLVCPALLCHCHCSRRGCCGEWSCSCRSLVARCSFSCRGKRSVRREQLLPALVQLEPSSLFQRRMRKQLFGRADFSLPAFMMRGPHKMTSLQVTAPRLRDSHSTLERSAQLWWQGACHSWAAPLMSRLSWSWTRLTQRSLPASATLWLLQPSFSQSHSRVNPHPCSAPQPCAQPTPAASSLYGTSTSRAHQAATVLQALPCPSHPASKHTDVHQAPSCSSCPPRLPRRQLLPAAGGSVPDSRGLASF